MKVKFTLAMAFLCSSNLLFAQDEAPCYSENFSSSNNGWTYSQGASIQTYHNPAPGNNCVNGLGIVTPGVGGNNPCNLKTGSIISNGGSSIHMTFDMFVLDANLKCDTWKNFPCVTSIDVVYYVGSTAYQGAVDYILPPNGPANSSQIVVNFYVGNNLPPGTAYNIELFFKPKSGVGQANQQNTKYVLDNFTICDIQDVAERGTVKANTKIDLSSSTSNMFPNPTNGARKITIPNASTLSQIRIYDNGGKLMRTFAAQSTLEISGLQRGLYIIESVKKNGEKISNKLIVN